MRNVTFFLMKYFKITIASIIYGAGVSLFLDPNTLITGGVTGISMVLHKLTGLETGTGILLINLPILLLSVIWFGWQFTASTIYCIAVCSIATNYLGLLTPLSKDPLVASVLGGGLLALGLGIVFREGTTTGGTDIIVKILRIRYPHLKTGTLLFMVDLIILLMAAFTLQQLNNVVYGGISAIVTSHMLDVILYGADEARLLFVISDSHETIKGVLLQKLHVGVTCLNGKGAYLEKPKEIILCVVKKQIAPKAVDLIKQEDPYAFVIISSASEIYGLGYKSL